MPNTAYSVSVLPTCSGGSIGFVPPSVKTTTEKPAPTSGPCTGGEGSCYARSNTVNFRTKKWFWSKRCFSYSIQFEVYKIFLMEVIDLLLSAWSLSPAERIGGVDGQRINKITPANTISVGLRAGSMRLLPSISVRDLIALMLIRGPTMLASFAHKN